jgi:hypothetical protein
LGAPIGLGVSCARRSGGEAGFTAAGLGARGFPLRPGRSGGSIPGALSCLRPWSGIGDRVYAWNGGASPAIMRRRRHPTARAYPRSAGYRTGMKLRVEVGKRSA